MQCAACALTAAALLCGCREPSQEPSSTIGSGAPSPTASPASSESPPSPELGRSKHALVYRSLDQGRSWAPLSEGIAAGAVVRGFVSGADTAFVATERHGVYALERGADRWQGRSEGLPAAMLVTAFGAAIDRLLVGTQAAGVFVSTDGGRHWRAHADGSAASMAGSPVRCLLAVGQAVLAGTDRGIYVSADRGETWAHVFGDLQVNGFSFASGKAYAAVVDGALVSRDEGATWAYIYRGDTLHDIAGDGVHVHAMTLSHGLLRSADDGATWMEMNEGLPAKERWYTFQVQRVGDDLLAAQWDGIYRAVGGGATWTRIDAGLPSTDSYTHLGVTPLGIFAGAR
jgi:photosystem II stability/assembly factor-like uncharacterized protein